MLETVPCLQVLIQLWNLRKGYPHTARTPLSQGHDVGLIMSQRAAPHLSANAACTVVHQALLKLAQPCNRRLAAKWQGLAAQWGEPTLDDRSHLGHFALAASILNCSGLSREGPSERRHSLLGRSLGHSAI